MPRPGPVTISNRDLFKRGRLPRGVERIARRLRAFEKPPGSVAAARLEDQGKTVPEIARALRVSQRTVQRWLSLWRYPKLDFGEIRADGQWAVSADGRPCFAIELQCPRCREPDYRLAAAPPEEIAAESCRRSDSLLVRRDAPPPVVNRRCQCCGVLMAYNARLCGPCSLREPPAAPELDGRETAKVAFRWKDLVGQEFGRVTCLSCKVPGRFILAGYRRITISEVPDWQKARSPARRGELFDAEPAD